MEMMAPGKYLIVAGRYGYCNIKARDHPLSMLYYPGTAEREKAAVVTRNAGSDMEGLDLRAPALEK